MRASRLLSILLLLQTRGRLTARQLADTLEVSERTIYRDVASLHAHTELLKLGAEVEVLAPHELRERLEATVRAMAGIYLSAFV